MRRQDLSDEVSAIFDNDLELPISHCDLPLDKGWECERIVVRAIAGKGERTVHGQRGPAIYQGQIVNLVQKSQNKDSQEAGHLEVEAVLGSTLEKMSRYRSALKRELYSAIDMLSKMQAERREAKS